MNKINKQKKDQQSTKSITWKDKVINSRQHKLLQHEKKGWSNQYKWKKCITTNTKDITNT